MLENHAFDNMLGWLPNLPNPLTSNFCNTFNGQEYCATKNGAYVDPDPDHSVGGTALELYGTATPVDQFNQSAVLMNGFVQSYANAINASFAPIIMDCFEPSAVPVISTLAQEFTLLDNYFASVPGPTFPNRLFYLSATSHGYADNDPIMTALGWPQRSIFGVLQSDSRVYFSDVPSALLFNDSRDGFFTGNGTSFKFYQESFASDVANGDLPTFTFIEPSYMDIPGIHATDEHPGLFFFLFFPLVIVV
jgi:phospholipase C